MKNRDYTDMGGMQESFLTTHWSIIENVHSGGENDQELIDSLLKRYWKPIYCYVRHMGYDNEQAKDLTQGFFHEIVLGRNLIGRANQAKGRFRSFLIAALNRYVINVRQQATTKKQLPKGKLISLDDIDLPELPETVGKSAPEKAFNYAWVSVLLDQILTEVEKKCYQDGKATHWQLFNDRILQPITNRTLPPTMKEICDKYGIDDAIKATNMMVTVKRRLQTAFKQQLRSSVTSDAEVYDELQEIIQLFPKISAM
jgi:RNA polymerase sigma-70 factor (ECF subfamily)